MEKHHAPKRRGTELHVRNRRGFTAVELSAVLAATGVATVQLMSGLATGGLMGAHETSRRSSCQSNLKQMGLAMRQYTQDYDEKFAPTGAPRGNGYVFGWAESLQPYLKSTQLYQCPEEKHPGTSVASRSGYTDYWYNSNLARTSEAAVMELGKTITFGDGDGGSATSNARYNLNRLPKGWLTTPNSPARRHENGANYAFVDGHVKWVTPAHIRTQPPSPSVSYTFSAG
jgi:prepilin-type processing-associated H-X9-DG protein